MQEAIPFRTYVPATTASNRRLPPRNQSSDGAATPNVLVASSGDEDCVKRLVTENSVIVFGKRGCCMCHVVKKLLLGLGVNPSVIEVDENEETWVVKELSKIDGEGEAQFPVVFVGGKLFGGLERVMATHISGELVPILKDARALWL